MVRYNRNTRRSAGDQAGRKDEERDSDGVDQVADDNRQSTTQEMRAQYVAGNAGVVIVHVRPPCVTN